MRRTVILSVILGAGCATAPPAERKELDRIERQLSELYRPLAAMVEESRLSVQDFLKKEGRAQILPSDREATEDELRRWIEKFEGDLMPRNDRMCALIRSKRELVDGPSSAGGQPALPPSWQALLDHEDAWKSAHEKWKKEGVAYPFHSPTPFPRSLERELKKTIQELQERRDALRKS